MQWTAIQLSAIVTGFVGGILSERELRRLGFLLCGVLVAGALSISVLFIEEPAAPPHNGWREMVRELKRALRSRTVLIVEAFALVWSFNPFTQAVLYMHMTEALGHSEDFYGKTVSLIAIGSLVAPIGHGLYCRRIPMRWQVHASTVAGILSSWVYWALGGFSYMTGNMVLVNLAARSCPMDAPATLFAIFMVLCNLGSCAATWLGGVIYEFGKAHWGTVPAFNVLVFVAGGRRLPAGCSCPSCRIAYWGPSLARNERGQHQ